MNNDLFAPVPKKKLYAYGGVFAGIVLGSIFLMLFLGEPLATVLRGVGAMTLICAVLLGAGVWLVGGEKTEVRSDSSSTSSSTTKVPIRLRAAMPFIIGLVVLSQLLKLLALISSK